jgi:uncharacterized membrane protein
MERGQIALFFVQSIFSFVHSVVGMNALCTFGYHLKPIRMKHLLSFVAQAIAAAVVVWAYLWTLEIVGL